jgi:hypothetical protein
MIAGKYNLIIDRAATFALVMTLKDNSGAVIDLTNGLNADATFTGDVRETLTKKRALQFTIGFTGGGTDGKATISLTAAQTKVLNQPIAYEYDVFMISGGKTTRLLEGTVTVRQNRTNNV